MVTLLFLKSRIASALGRRFTANLSVQVLVISVFKWEGTIFRCVVAGAGVSDMALFVVLEIKNPTGYWWGAGSGGVLRFHERSGLGSSLLSAPANAAQMEPENFVETQAVPAYAVGESGERFYFDNIEQKLGVAQPAAYWSPCGVFDKNEKLVRTFSRQTVKGVSGRTASLSVRL